VTTSKRKPVHQIETVSKQSNPDNNKTSNGRSSDTNIFVSIREKFATIMKTNQETTTLTAVSRENMSEKEKMEWWQKREAANQLLQELLDHDMETSLLGPWKVSFLRNKFSTIHNIKKESAIFQILLTGSYRDKQMRCDLDQMAIIVQRKLEALLIENGHQRVRFLRPFSFLVFI
jgi:hypothetical protein